MHVFWSTIKEAFFIPLLKVISSLMPSVPLHRYWNANITDHFYTTNLKEIGESTQWRYEGIQCNILKYNLPGSVPLYRYWDGGNHLYTISTGIGTTVPGQVGKNGYKSQGVTGYCFNEHYPGTIPLYRYADLY